MTKQLLTLALVALSFGSLASAGTVQIPKDNPAAIVKVPDSWEPEETDHGYAIESPDQVATIIIEAASKKGVDKLIDESIAWLTEEQDVKIKESTKSEKEFEVAGRTWSRISWEASSKEWGASVVGFLFAPGGQGKVITITYWITKKDFDKHMPTIEKILASVKLVE